MTMPLTHLSLKFLLLSEAVNLMPEETRKRGMSGSSNLENREVLYTHQQVTGKTLLKYHY